MNAATLIDNFDLLAEAPGGVRKLRELILQLAVRGKLVEQREEEGDGEGKEGAVDGPYPVPKGWQWTTLKNIGEVNPRNEADDSSEVGFAPMAAISQEYGIEPDYERRTWGDVKKGFTHFADGDVGVAKITPCFQNGKSSVFRNLPNGIGAGTTELHVFRPATGAVMPDYVWIWLKSPRFLRDGEAQMTGSAGQKRVPRAYFAETPFPLPPLAEQKRIVARVDELMKRCDALEARQNERNERHKALVSSCLHALTVPASTFIPHPSTFSSILQPSSFNLLLATPESVAELRKTILQLAVQGRLVPQDPRDEPAIALCLTRSAQDEMVSPSEYRHPVPPSWMWIRFKRTGDQRLGKMLDKAKNRGSLKPYLRNTNVQWNRFDLDDVKLMRIDADEEDALRLKPGDILICEGGEPGRCALWRSTEIEMYFQKALHRVRTYNGVLAEYLALNLEVDCHNGVLEKYFTGATIKHLTGRSFARYPIPLPPLSEQKRIVAKVNELMALCDALEAKLTQSRADADTLVAAVVHRMHEGSADR